jgi:hypothetical protein
MKTFVGEKNQNTQKLNSQTNQNEFFEDIDPAEENDEENQNDQFMYNLDINSPGICRKCGIKREIFRSNNVFHFHIRVCFDDKTKLAKALMTQSDVDDKKISIITSQVKNIAHKEYGFRFYQYAIA